MIKLKTILTEIEPDYRWSHKAPSNDGYDAPLHNISPDIYPENIYSSKGAYIYGDRSATTYSDQESIDIIRRARNKPDMAVTIYRSVPPTVTLINPGDWVTINKRYAIQHGKSNLDGEYTVLSKTVPAKHLYTDGNSIHEWGYDPS